MISELCCRITRYEVINVTVLTEKWLSKAVNRMTDNVMVKRKKTSNDLQNTTEKTYG